MPRVDYGERIDELEMEAKRTEKIHNKIMDESDREIRKLRRDLLRASKVIKHLAALNMRLINR